MVGFRKFEFSDEYIKEKIRNGLCRYENIETYEIIKKFSIDKTIDFNFKKIDMKLENNICFLNKTREIINKKFGEIKIGSKCILRENYEKFGYFKNYEFIVESIENGIVNGKFRIKDII